MPITEKFIRTLATMKSFNRGQEYYDAELVISLHKRGGTLMAQVEGNSYEPYEVTVTFNKDEFVEAHCTCPYDWGGYCKHVVAVLLAYYHHQDEIEEKPDIAELLAGLDKPTLHTLLTELLQKESHLIDWVETRIISHTQSVKTATQPLEFPAVDLKPFARQTKSIFRRGYYYGVGTDIASELADILKQVEPYLEYGDGRNSLAVLRTITDVFLSSSWEAFMDEDEFGIIFERIPNLFTEAILLADLNETERFTWRDRLETWQSQVADYSYDEAWDLPIETAEQGWDDPFLQNILAHGYQGTETELAPFRDDPTIPMRLRVLEHQGRTLEYLHLAEAADDTASYVTMLVKVGRVDEAINYKYITQVDEALALAKTLVTHQQVDRALQMGKCGLTLRGEPGKLARWLRDLAHQEGQANLALNAAEVAFRQYLSQDDYEAIRFVAGERWVDLKPELLKSLIENDSYSYDRIDIYLSEGMIDEAVRYIKNQGYIGFDTLRKVTKAAVESHPEWVIERCQQQAEQIMDAGKSKAYYHAISWLETAKLAYHHANRDEIWQIYIETLINKHARKYSLRPSLEGLR